MTPEEIEACWQDPQHWRWGVYFCREDPRVIVPKYIKWMGWTVNAARPAAIPVTLFLLAILAVPIFVVVFKGAAIGTVMLTVAVSITVLCLLCGYLASTTRWSN